MEDRIKKKEEELAALKAEQKRKRLEPFQEYVGKYYELLNSNMIFLVKEVVDIERDRCVALNTTSVYVRDGDFVVYDDHRVTIDYEDEPCERSKEEFDKLIQKGIVTANEYLNK